MGDRVSISFKKGEDESPAIFSHWGGLGFVECVKEYCQGLVLDIEGSYSPLDRLEPDTVIIDFLAQYLPAYIREHDNYPGTGMKGRVTSNIYMGKTSSDGDNSDNGHWVFEITDEEIRTHDGWSISLVRRK
jgi:hypothetical protein